MTNFDVEVTLQDIKDGNDHAGEFNKCPIAISLKHLGCEKIDADEDRILLTYNNKRYIYKTPRIANHFISDFDSDRDVKPISFTLEKPQLATIKDERISILQTSNWERD